MFAERVGSRVSHGPAEAVDALLHKVFGADIFIRMADEGRGEPTTWIDAQDIVPPPDCAADPVRARCPDMEPFEVYRDELVTISAILVDHRLCYPAYGFRLDSAHGSVVISGDTTECDNMVRLARRAESLGIDSIWVADHLVAPVGVQSIYPFDKSPDPKPGAGAMPGHSRSAAASFSSSSSSGVFTRHSAYQLSTASPKTSPQRPKGRLEVTMIEPCS